MTVTRRVRLLAATGVAIAGAAAGAAGVTPAGPHRVAAVTAHPLAHELTDVGSLQTPPTTSECLKFKVRPRHCYNPIQFAKAYNINGLHSQGIDGRGRTIVIVDSFGSPTIAHDLKAFDAAFGIPDPPSFQIIAPVGAPPPFNPADGDMAGWAAETTLDVEWSHVMAPGANILLVVTPVSETEGVTGFPEIVAAENYVIDHNLGDVISQSFGATEETFPTRQSLLDLRGSFRNAARHHVTVLGSSGDNGATSQVLDGSCCYPMPVNSWPSSDPLVTSIGGTMLTLADNGDRLAPDVAWNASGGGLSSVFERPDFQDRVENITGDRRGTPDISMSGAVDGAVVYYRSFLPSHAVNGPWGLVAGTSESAPLFAGIVAMADQLAGRRLGNINSALYSLRYGTDGLVDVTSGNNSATFTDSTGTHTVVGYPALPGYDLVTGLGTVDAARFVPALVRASGDDDRGGADG